MRNEGKIKRMEDFHVDENHHCHFTIRGRKIRGEEIPAHLSEQRISLDFLAESMLLNAETNGYNQNLLEEGREYKVVIIQGALLKLRGQEITTTNIKKYAHEFGYQEPVAGLTLAVAEVFDFQINEQGIWYVISLHKPIEDRCGMPSVLCANRIKTMREERFISSTLDYTGTRHEGVRGGMWTPIHGFLFIKPT